MTSPVPDEHAPTDPSAATSMAAEAAVPVERLQDAVMILEGPDARIRYVSQIAEAILSVRREDWLGRTLAEVIAGLTFYQEGQDEPLPFDRLPGVRALAGERLESVPIRMVDGAGLERTLSVSSEPLMVAEGLRRGAMVVFRDTSHIGFMHEQFAKVFHDAALCILVSDLEGRITAINPAGLAMLGYEERELLGVPCTAIVRPDEVPEVTRMLRLMASGEAESQSAVYHWRTRNGSYRVLRKVGSLVRDAHHQPSAILCVMVDITSDHAEVVENRHERERLREAQRLGRLAFWDWDVVADRFYPSEETLEMIGLDASWNGTSLERFFSLIHPDDLDLAREAVAKGLRTGEPYEIEFRFVKPDGQAIWFMLRGRAKLDEAGRPVWLSGAALDITERKRSEERLRRSESDLAEAQRLTRLGNWTVDLATGRIRMSAELARLYELPEPEDEVPYDLVWAAVEPTERDRIERWFMQAVEQNQPFQYDHHLQLPSGRRPLVHTQGHMVTDAQGRVVRVFGTTQDISERQSMQEHLRRNEAILREAQRIARLGVWEWEVVADQVSWSDELLALLDLDSSWQNAPLSRILELAHPEDAPAVRQAVEQALAHGQDYEMEFRARRADGHYLTLLTRVAVFVGADGAPSRLIGTVLDITALRESEETIRRSQAMLADAERLAHIGSWEYDPVSDRYNASDELYRIIGVEPAPGAHSGDLLRSVVHPEDREHVIAMQEEALAKGIESVIQYRIVRPDGQIKWVQVSWRLFRDARGRILRVVGTMKDVTDHREMEHMRSEFLSIVSHELRTPLTTIGAPLGMLESKLSEDPLSRELFAIVMRSVQRMKRLVDDILDMERLLHGRLPIQAEPVELEGLLVDVVQEMQPLAVLRAVTLEVTAAEGTVLGDRLRLSQVLTNLIDNAIAFSPSGATVSLHAEPDNGCYRVSVVDHGPGIAPALQQAIFEPFRQGESASTRRKSGSGLGLAVARSIVEQHEGRLWVESKPGAGSTFSFVLPAAQKETGGA